MIDEDKRNYYKLATLIQSATLAQQVRWKRSDISLLEGLASNYLENCGWNEFSSRKIAPILAIFLKNYYSFKGSFAMAQQEGRTVQWYESNLGTVLYNRFARKDKEAQEKSVHVLIKVWHSASGVRFVQQDLTRLLRYNSGADNQIKLFLPELLRMILSWDTQKAKITTKIVQEYFASNHKAKKEEE